MIDITLKELANTSINELLEFTNIDYRVIESGKTEFTEMKNKRYHLDYVGKTKDKIYIHIEFKARAPTKEELKKILTYAILLHDYTGCFVETYIICVQSIPKDHIIYQYSKENVFKIRVISLKNIDGDEKINTISKKIKNNEELTKTEILALELIPFTSYEETTEEMTLKTAKLTNEITTLTEDELNKIKYIQQGICSKVIEEQYQDEIMEEIKMRNTLYDNARKTGQKEGMKKGREEGREEGIKQGMEKVREEGMEKERTNTENIIKTLIQNGTLPANTLNYIYGTK